MQPANRLRVLAASILAWGAVVLSTGVATAWAQTTEPIPASAPSESTAPAPAATPDPGTGGKSPCDNRWVGIGCALVDAADKYANGDLPGAVGEVAGGVAAPVVGAVTDNIATVLTAWVSDGAAALVGKLGGFLVDGTTTPHLEAGWFASHYRAMVALAGLLIFPFLLSSLLAAIVRQDFGRLVRTVFGYLPLAGILTAGAVSLVVLGLELTDSLSSWVGAGTGTDAAKFLTEAGVALKAISVIPGGMFLEFAAGLILVIGAAAVWLELLIRSAAIYVAVLFLPLALAGMVWPATSHWIRRLAHLLIAVILSKFVIVAILSLAASGLAAAAPGGGDGGGLGSAFAGGALLALAAFSPLALLRMAPIVEANLAASVGSGRAGSRVSSAAANKVMGNGRSLIDDAQAWNLRDKTSPAPGSRSAKPKTTTATAGTTSAATGGAAAAADAGLKVVQAAGRQANGLAHGVGSLPDSPAGNGNGTSGNAGPGRQSPMGSNGFPLGSNGAPGGPGPAVPPPPGGERNPNGDNGSSGKDRGDGRH